MHARFEVRKRGTAHTASIKKYMKHNIHRYATEHEREAYGYTKHAARVHEHNVSARGYTPLFWGDRGHDGVSVGRSEKTKIAMLGYSRSVRHLTQSADTSSWAKSVAS